MRTYVAVAAFVALSALPAYGQFTPAVQTCTRDLTKHCGNSEFADCLKVHFEAFSGACKTALVRIAAVTAACSNDIAKQCPAMKPGSGRLLLCVKNHYPALTDECKTAIGRASQNRLTRQPRTADRGADLRARP